MKKLFLLACTLAVLLVLAGCAVKGDDGLIKKARQVIPVSDAETIDIEIAGYTDEENSRLVWFVTGNEYQAHYYAPIEFKAKGNESYEFVKLYKPIERGMDINALMWKKGYSFIINNESCAFIIITKDGKTEKIKVSQTPFIYYYQGENFEYKFIDKNGEEL